MQREFGPHEEEALSLAVDEIVEGFEDAIGYEGWVPHQLLHLRHGYVDGRLFNWDRDTLGTLLLDIFPRKVLVDDEDVEQVVPTTKAFLRWLHEAHGLTGEPLPRLLQGLDHMAPDVARGLRDTSRFGPAKSFASMLAGAGIDLTDAGAVDGFVEAFNARPFEERHAALPLPGDRRASLLDDVAFPPVLRPPVEEMDDHARASTLHRWVTGFVAAVGAGRPLTKTGNLRLADGREIVERLGLDDIARIEEYGSLRTTGDLPTLDLILQVARTAGYVKVRKSMLTPTARAGDLVARPAASWQRLVDALLDVGIMAQRYRGQQYFVPPWIDHLDDRVDDLLLTLYVSGRPMAIDELVDLARQDLAVEWDIPSPEGDDLERVDRSIWWEMPDDNVRLLLSRLETAGVVELSGVEVVVEQYGIEDERGGTVALTTGGRVIVADRAIDAGAPVADAGRLRELAAPDLLEALAAASAVEGEVELEVWITDRGPVEALRQIVGIAPRVSPAMLPTVASALLACLESVATTDAALLLAGLLDHRVLGPLVGGWLLGHGVEDIPHVDPVDALVSMAALGAGDEAVLILQQSGSVTEQQAQLETARALAGPQAVPLLEAVADMHEDKRVAKAARKALFRLGVRR